MKTGRSKFILITVVFLLSIASGILVLGLIAGKVPAKTAIGDDDLAQCNAWIALTIAFTWISAGLCIGYLRATRRLPGKGTTDKLLRFFAGLFLLPLIAETLLYVFLLILLNG